MRIYWTERNRRPPTTAAAPARRRRAPSRSAEAATHARGRAPVGAAHRRRHRRADRAAGGRGRRPSGASVRSSAAGWRSMRSTSSRSGCSAATLSPATLRQAASSAAALLKDGSGRCRPRRACWRDRAAGRGRNRQDGGALTRKIPGNGPPLLATGGRRAPPFFAPHCTPDRLSQFRYCPLRGRPDISSPASRGFASILARGNDAFGEEKRPRGLDGKDLPADRQRAIHERAPAGVLPREAAAPGRKTSSRRPRRRCSTCRTRTRTIPISPTAPPRKPTGRSSCARATASAS